MTRTLSAAMCLARLLWRADYLSSFGFLEISDVSAGFETEAHGAVCFFL